MDVKWEKKFLLCHHTEDLAMGCYMDDGTMVRIIKNLRVCGDCHTATRYISKVVEKEIIGMCIDHFHISSMENSPVEIIVDLK